MSLAAKLLTAMLLICIPLRVLGWDWQTRVTIVVKDQPLQEVCELLEKQYGIHFSYSRELVNLSRRVTLTAHNRRLRGLLDELFAPDAIRYTRVGDQLVLLPEKHSTRTISGYVQDAATGEKLVGATIYAPSLHQGTTTNQYGFFSFTTARDTGQLIVSYIGYNSVLQPVMEKGNQLLTVALSPLANLKEVVITGTDKSGSMEQAPLSKVNIATADIQSMPKLLGEADVMRTLQSLPGVGGGMEGVSGLHVRGGSVDQNLILIDGSPVFNFSHFFGVYSLLNADVVKTTDLYKGAFPARFGGRLSSVVDITLKDGDMQKFHGDVAIGLISAKFNVEGPIIKDKTSFIVSARRSYPDLIYNVALRSDDDLGRDGRFYAYFYDINLKVNHIFSPKDRVFLSYYQGEDNMLIQQSTDSARLADSTRINAQMNRFKIGWGNTIAALRWNHVYGPKLFSNLTFNYSRYEFSTEYGYKYNIPASGEFSDQYGRYSSRMENAGVKMDFDYRPNPGHGIRFGGAATMHYFKPAMSVFEDKSSPVKPLDTAARGARINGLEMLLYAEDDWEVSPKLWANLGVHMSGFAVEGRFYYSIQPRLGLRYLLPHHWVLKAAYTHMNQYIHLLSNNGTTLPTDIWVPSTPRVAPMLSRQLAAGITKVTNNRLFEFSLEGYYKTMHNMIEYTDIAGFISPDMLKWDQKVAVGQGWSYGGEAMISKRKGSTTGRIGYTLSWSNRRFPGINNGHIFPYKYDRRHVVEVVLTQQLGKHWEASASWHFMTGSPITLPVATYEGTSNASPWDPGTDGGAPVDRYSNRYNGRTENIHRLDIGITYTKQKKYWRKSWNFSIFNVYNQPNPFYYFIKRDAAAQERYLAKVVILPVLPSITYSVRF
ncbi:TonB-dependent receptor [Chitinophaga vietnamensis]|uniref:TonB-dependent receptor n=1 Tax=Chitinophaga vietnamensis TaxID=2593957 RepID=UPI00117873E7|nr:TonB-dependent receptor [Chitinophaga vietnamensis]